MRQLEANSYQNSRFQTNYKEKSLLYNNTCDFQLDNRTRGSRSNMIFHGNRKRPDKAQKLCDGWVCLYLRKISKIMLELIPQNQVTNSCIGSDMWML